MPRTVGVPTPMPEGGTAVLLPMDGQELKKLAKRIVRLEYLVDGKGRHVFGPDNKPVPKVDQDDDALIDSAIKKCKRITGVAVPVFIRGEQQFDGEGDERKPRVVVVSVDAETRVCDEHDEPFEGRCLRCASIIVGDYATTAAQMLRDILSEVVEITITKSVEPTKDEIDAAVAKGDPAPSQRVVELRAEQLVAEWLIEQSVELARAKKAAERKN